MNNKGLLGLSIGICLILILMMLSIAGCAQATPSQAPSKAPVTAAPTTAPVTSSGATAKPAIKPITLKALYAWPAPAAGTQVFFVWEDMVKAAVAKNYPGELVFERVGGPEAVPTASQIDAVKGGVVDVNYTAAGYIMKLMPLAKVHVLRESYPWEERENGAYDLLNKLHQQALNCQYMGNVNWGNFQFWSFKKVTKPDFTGLRIRSNPIYDSLNKKLGGTPLDIPETDVYSAIERGMIDAYWSAFIGIRQMGWQEVTKFACGPSIYVTPGTLLINLDTWNKIPKHLQDLMIGVTKQMERDIVAKYTENYNQEKDLLTKAKIEFVTWSKEDEAYFKQVAYGLSWDDLKKAFPDAAQLEKLMRKSY